MILLELRSLQNTIKTEFVKLSEVLKQPKSLEKRIKSIQNVLNNSTQSLSKSFLNNCKRSDGQNCSEQNSTNRINVDKVQVSPVPSTEVSDTNQLSDSDPLQVLPNKENFKTKEKDNEASDNSESSKETKRLYKKIKKLKRRSKHANKRLHQLQNTSNGSSSVNESSSGSKAFKKKSSKQNNPKKRKRKESAMESALINASKYQVKEISPSPKGKRRRLSDIVRTLNHHNDIPNKSLKILNHKKIVAIVAKEKIEQLDIKPDKRHLDQLFIS